VVTDMHRGEHVAALDRTRRLSEAADLWVSSLGTTRREKTVHGYLSVLKVHVLPRWADERLSSITHNEVQLWIDDQLRDGKSPAQITKGYRVLRMVLGRAVKAGWLRTNPCASDLDLPRLQRREMLHLTPEQVEALANAFENRQPTSKHDWRTGPRPDFALYVRFEVHPV
jgi:integrase